MFCGVDEDEDMDFEEDACSGPRCSGGLVTSPGSARRRDDGAAALVTFFDCALASRVYIHVMAIQC